MTDGNDEPEEGEEGNEGEEVDPAVAAFEERLDAVAEELDDAETEVDLDEVDEHLDEIESDLEDADLPEPEVDDEEDEDDVEDPREELEDRISDLRDGVEDERGPYDEDVADEINSASSAIAGEEWTPEGIEDLEEVLTAFVADIEGTVGTDIEVRVDDPSFEEDPYVEGSDLAEFRETLDATADAVTDAGLHPDEDADTIADLLDRVDQLGEEIDDAHSWDDLEVREKLQRHGFYEVLNHFKDFPPEWAAIKVWEKRGRADMILLAYDLLDSNFMEEHCVDALARLGPEEAVQPMLTKAQRRDADAIRVLGKVGSEQAVQPLLNHADAGDLTLRTSTLKALGEIGSHEATETVAQQLAADEPAVRSQAARSLGLLGDTRAIEPLADVLEADDSDQVRASAAWALNQIGTERAREAVADYADDRSYVVQAEAEKAVQAV